MIVREFRKVVWGHYRRHERRLPWRKTRDPYAILVSEIMLQQTQVSRVEGYYEKFLKRFPDFRSLARARTADVLRAWQGLGYNRRALALQKIAKIVLEECGGRLPRERAALEALPGIGRGTSGSLRAFIWNEPEVFIETNIRRVFIHFFFPKKHGVTDEVLERYIRRTLDMKRPREWYWALMDYGAMLGAAGARRGAGAPNPNRRSAAYKKQGRFAGSDRELRGKVLRLVLSKRRVPVEGLPQKLGPAVTKDRAARVVEALIKEGFIKRKSNYIHARS